VTTLSKTLLAAIVVVMTLLFVLTTFVPYAPARVEAQEYFTPDEIAVGLEYSFQRRLFYWASVAVELALLCTLALTSLGRRWADRCLAWTGERRLFAVLLFGLGYYIVDQLLYLPISLARLHHARVWGMYNLGDLDWLRDRSIAMGVDLVSKGIAGAGFYTLLILLPRTWWLLAPLGGSGLGVAYVFLAPILIDPLFNDFTPIEQTEWRRLQPRVRSLIAKAGVDVEEILVKNASRQSNHTNAYFTGFGSTRRIVLYDTLLKNHTDDEIESVLAHELGHWMHDHIVKGLLLGTLAAIVACLVLDQLLRGAVGRAPWNLQSTADPAGLPLVLLIVFLGNWATAPLQNGVSRYFEREADRESLILAGRPEVFIKTEQKLATINLQNVAPTPWNVWLFSSHPPTLERIRMAKEWK
jgi:STE24 endopeptidase